MTFKDEDGIYKSHLYKIEEQIAPMYYDSNLKDNFLCAALEMAKINNLIDDYQKQIANYRQEVWNLKETIGRLMENQNG